MTNEQAGEAVRITAADGHVLDAYVARPPAKARGALVVAQDAFGVGTDIRSVCDHYAASGYVSIAPSFYDRQQRNAVFDPAAFPARSNLFTSNSSA